MREEGKREILLTGALFRWGGKRKKEGERGLLYNSFAGGRFLHLRRRGGRRFSMRKGDFPSCGRRERLFSLGISS